MENKQTNKVDGKILRNLVSETEGNRKSDGKYRAKIRTNRRKVV